MPPGGTAQTGVGPTWRYKAPRYATIAGGVLALQMTARDGGALVAIKVKEQPVTLAICENPGCHSYERIVPITATGASELWETAYCFSNSEGMCPAENFNPDEGNGHEAAEANITSAQIVLSTNVIPAASGFGGTLLGTSVTGTGTLDFTATDPGPGVYQTRAKVDGQQVWAATPNLNEGKCISTGSLEGVRAFDYVQPCPTETAVHAEINTAGLPDGHARAHGRSRRRRWGRYDGLLRHAHYREPPNDHHRSRLLSAAGPRRPGTAHPLRKCATLTAQWREVS